VLPRGQDEGEVPLAGGCLDLRGQVFNLGPRSGLGRQARGGIGMGGEEDEEEDGEQGSGEEEGDERSSSAWSQVGVCHGLVGAALATEGRSSLSVSLAFWRGGGCL